MIQEFGKRWAGKKVLVIGDVMVDVEWRTEYARPSAERGGEIVREQSQQRFPGGAANVAMNCRALGAAVDLIGAQGMDRDGTWLKVFLAEHSVHLLSGQFPYRHSWEETTVKHRILKNGEPVMRIDRDVFQELATLETRKAIVEHGPYDALLLSDYQKGAFHSPLLLQEIVRTFRKHHPFAIVGANPKPALVPHLPAGLDLITVNADEYAQIAARAENTIDVARRLRTRYLMHTRGRRGLWLSAADGRVTQQQGLHVPELDPAGCGDAVFAAAMLGLTVTDELHKVAAIANAAGAVKVSQRGTVPVTAPDLFRLLAVAEPGYRSKDRCMVSD